jgi:OHCU decarboxylase
MAAPKITLAVLNTLDEAGFTARLGGIFEHSPWIAQAAWAMRPFARMDALHGAMLSVLAEAGEAAELALLRAHPELAKPASLTAASASEQAGLGLDRLAAEKAAAFLQLNAQYRARFGFPFIIAVRGQRNAEAIEAALRQRLGHTTEAERRTALAEVARIARFRLEDAIDE